MYHLLEENERAVAIRQCLDRLRPGGALIVSFISAYAPILEQMEKCPHEISIAKGHFLDLLNDGRAYDNSGFTDAYFINPANVKAFFTGFDIETVKLIAAEGVGVLCEDTLKGLPEEDFMEWIDLFYKIADHEMVLGSSMHLLYIGRKRNK
jgi:SAM-dependent methyltransferase